MMRILRGIDEGLAALTRRPGYEEPQLTPAAAARTEALFGEPLTATQAVERIVADVRANRDSGHQGLRPPHRRRGSRRPGDRA